MEWAFKTHWYWGKLHACIEMGSHRQAHQENSVVFFNTDMHTSPHLHIPSALPPGGISTVPLLGSSALPLELCGKVDGIYWIWELHRKQMRAA